MVGLPLKFIHPGHHWCNGGAFNRPHKLDLSKWKLYFFDIHRSRRQSDVLLPTTSRAKETDSWLQEHSDHGRLAFHGVLPMEASDSRSDNHYRRFHSDQLRVLVVDQFFRHQCVEARRYEVIRLVTLNS